MMKLKNSFFILALFSFLILFFACEKEDDNGQVVLEIRTQGEGTTNPPTGNHEYEINTEVSISAIPEEGWQFIKWTGNVMYPDSAETSIMMNASKSITAVFEELVIDEDGEFGGGDGTLNNPYLIANAEQLNNVRNHLDKNFKQVADIDLSDFASGGGWEPLGSLGNNFQGIYNGNNHSITNLYINRPDDSHIGLFGYLSTSFGDDGNAIIKNLNIYGAEITGDSNTGILLGSSWSCGIVENVYVQGSVSGGSSTGLLAGYTYGKITKSSSSGNVQGAYGVGGLIGGTGVDAIVKDSYSNADVFGHNSVGGLIGNNAGDVIKTYATGSVEGDGEFGNSVNAGGLVGRNTGRIEQSYAKGVVTAHKDNGGGLVGDNDGVIYKSYANGNVFGENSLGGLAGSVSSDALVDQSYATGEVVGENGFNGVAGGLVGSLNGVIKNSYSTGNVSTINRVGGLAGVSGNHAKIENSYSTGKVDGNNAQYQGGLTSINYGEIISSYYNLETSEQDDEDKGTPKTTAEMTQQNTFQNWDFNNTWGIDPGTTYPYLKFQEQETYPRP